MQSLTALKRGLRKGQTMKDKSMLEATIIILIELLVGAIAGILMYLYTT